MDSVPSGRAGSRRVLAHSPPDAAWSFRESLLGATSRPAVRSHGGHGTHNLRDPRSSASAGRVISCVPVNYPSTKSLSVIFNYVGNVCRALGTGQRAPRTSGWRRGCAAACTRAAARRRGGPPPPCAPRRPIFGRLPLRTIHSRYAYWTVTTRIRVEREHSRRRLTSLTALRDGEVDTLYQLVTLVVQKSALWKHIFQESRRSE